MLKLPLLCSLKMKLIVTGLSVHKSCPSNFSVTTDQILTQLHGNLKHQEYMHILPPCQGLMIFLGVMITVDELCVNPLPHRDASLPFAKRGPCSTVGNVSGSKCESDCRSRGREFDPGSVPYFRGD